MKGEAEPSTVIFKDDMRIMAKNSGMTSGDGKNICCNIFMFIIFLSLLTGAAKLDKMKDEGSRIIALNVVAVALSVSLINIVINYYSAAS